jgi:hypothetical protein
MSFLSPLFLIGAFAAAVPILLHMLKREPEARVRFAAVKLLRNAPVEQARHRRLRELLLLALRVTALVLLALAFARPFFASAEEKPPALTVVALDTSLSMSAPGQFEKARQLAKDAIARAPSRDLAAVVTFADGAQVAAAPTRDRSLVTSAIDRAAPGSGTTRYRAALAAAAELIDRYGAGQGTIVIVSDLQESGWDAGGRATIPDSVRIEVADIGAPPPNIAVTAINRSEARLTALVQNAAAEAREVRVRLTIDDKPAGEGAAIVGANQSAEVPLPLSRGFAAAVSVDDRQGVQGDNQRFAILDNASRPAIAIVTPTGDLPREAFYLQQALAVGGTAAAFEVVGVASEQVAATIGSAPGPEGPGLHRNHAVVVLTSTRGLNAPSRARLAEYVQQGGGLLVAASDEVDPAVMLEILPDLKVGPTSESSARSESSTGANPHAGTTVRSGMPLALTPTDVRHPIFRPFGARLAGLGQVRFNRVVDLHGSCATLARFTNGNPSLVECPLGKGHALVIGSDLNNRGNDFPLHATFVPFIHETMRYLGAGQATVAEYLIGDGPGAQAQAPGIVTLPGSGGNPGRRAAINVNPAESDPRRLSVADFQAAVVRLEDGPAGGGIRRSPEEDRQQIWRYLLMAVMTALLAESLVAARTA